MTKIKLWISDIDGTIMNYDGSYTAEMKDLIEKINSSDVKFVLATGRMFDGAYHEVKKFRINSPVVCYQGAVVRTKDEILWQRPVETSLVKTILKYFKDKDIHTHLYENDILYVDDDNKRIMNSYCKGRGTNYTVVDSLLDVKLTSVPKVLAVIEDKNIMEQVKSDLKEKFKGVLAIVQSSPVYLEVNDINASKGNALNFLKQYWNIKTEEVLASGDQDNDIDLLKHAGIKVCVGDNSSKLAQIADFKCKDVDSNELVEIVKRYI